jgi:hypothetical protein
MEEERIAKKKSRFFSGLVLGMILGLVLAHYAPVWFDSYLPDSLRPGDPVVGEVLDKDERTDQLLLKISTDDGVLLATFTDKREEIDLLVESGDLITLRVEGYEPFLNDPPIERVQKTVKSAEAEPPPPSKEPTDSPPPRETGKFQRTMERQLDELEQKIAELEQLAEDIQTDIEPEARELLEELKAKRDVARQKLNELEESSGDAWEELRKGLERTWQELEEAFDRAASRLRTESPES